MLFGWATWFSLRLAPHFLCRCATGNAPAVRRKRIASVVRRKCKKIKTPEFEQETYENKTKKNI